MHFTKKHFESNCILTFFIIIYVHISADFYILEINYQEVCLDLQQM
jgi:hypothetical protein